MQRFLVYLVCYLLVLPNLLIHLQLNFDFGVELFIDNWYLIIVFKLQKIVIDIFMSQYNIFLLGSPFIVIILVKIRLSNYFNLSSYWK